MKRCLGVLAILCPLLVACQSAARPVPPYKVGDQVPMETLAATFQWNNDPLSFSAFSTKLLIIEFMSTTCKSCLQKLPLLDSLQAAYNGQIQIQLVTAESSQRVASFRKNNKLGSRLNLPLVTGDSVLASWFPHRYLSHVVWIQQGRVAAITTDEFVRADNIELALSGRLFAWPVKDDFKEYDYKKPLLMVNESNLPEPSHLPLPVYYTTFFASVEGVRSRYIEQSDSTKGFHRMAAINLPVIPLYLKAFHLPYDFPPANTVLRVKDTARLVYNPLSGTRTEWSLSNAYCYEAILPLSMPAVQRRHKMQQDLDRFLGLRTSLQTISLPCLVLKKSGGNATPPEVEEGVKKGLTITNILYALSHSRWGQPILNESGYGNRHYLPITKELVGDEALLRKTLRRHGLELVMATRPAEVLLIEDAEETPQ
ncbi:MAG TPA: hypothetical protein VMR70_18645 [Flavisolibacter sp.]|nr:hypothetical protein [Flavisolibacter sp.]